MQVKEATVKENIAADSNEDSRTEEKREHKRIPRRSFLKSMAGAAASLAVLSQVPLGRAHGWNMGIVADIPDEKLIDMYTKMLRSRWWEEMIKDEFLRGEDGLYGAYHIYIGQEAVAVGAIAALTDEDYIASTHRGHGHLIAKGGDLRKMSAEIYFRETGYNLAFGGSMHITDVSKGILGMNGIVGPAYLLAAGAAYGAKVKGTDQVAMAFGGDGSVQNGWFWSGLRNAALYNLPLVAIVENNGWQITIPVHRTTHLKQLSTIARGLEIPGETVDGQDVLAVYDVTSRAVARARAGEGPTLIEAKTYRYYDHAGLAGATVGEMGAFGLPYRSDREVHAWMSKDPIVNFRRTLVSSEVLTEEQATEIEESVKAEVIDSIEFARNSPAPDEAAALSHVFAEGQAPASQFGTV
jgi:acetoin:2,6-dichlorophenolindophenol oxidoreductase subunit alpha